MIRRRAMTALTAAPQDMDLREPRGLGGPCRGGPPARGARAWRRRSLRLARARAHDLDLREVEDPLEGHPRLAHADLDLRHGREVVEQLVGDPLAKGLEQVEPLPLDVVADDRVHA